MMCRVVLSCLVENRRRSGVLLHATAEPEGLCPDMKGHELCWCWVEE